MPTLTTETAPVSAMGLALEAMESVPVNVTALARRLGVKIVYDNALPDSQSGALYQDEDGQWTIVCNANHGANRQRFTIAHELGHYLWHRTRLGKGTNDTKAYRADESARLYNPAITRQHEVEANQFAAGLLMPEDQIRHFRETLRLNDDDALAYRLASIFKVSDAAMQWRIHNLKREGKL